MRAAAAEARRAPGRRTGASGTSRPHRRGCQRLPPTPRVLRVAHWRCDYWHVDLDEELKRIAAAARQLAAAGEELAGVIPTEPEAGRRVYLCAFQGASRTWLALDDGALPVDDRALVRSAVSIAALCELAEESAGGGKLEELRAQLVSLRLTEQPEGIEEAEAAALDLERTLGG